MIHAFLAAQAAVPPPNAVAVVNVRRLLAESSTGRSLMAKVAALREEKEKAFDERRDALDAALRRGAPAPAIQRLRVDLERFREDAESEVADITKSVEADFQRRLRPVLQQILDEDHLGVIFDVPNPVVVWAHPATDVTARAIALLDHPPKVKE